MLNIHHVALTAEKLERSSEFYDTILSVFGYTRHYTSDTVCSWVPPNGNVDTPELLVYAAKENQQANRHKLYDPGIHHLCFRVESEEKVDSVYDAAQRMNAIILDAPADYDNYAKNVGSKRYYAVYFTDPDGIKLEFAWMPR